MTKVSDMLDNPSARQLAEAIERLVHENIPACDKELSIQSFDRAVDQQELLEAWQYLHSSIRAQYKYWLSRNDHVND